MGEKRGNECSSLSVSKNWAVGEDLRVGLGKEKCWEHFPGCTYIV